MSGPYRPLTYRPPSAQQPPDITTLSRSGTRPAPRSTLEVLALLGDLERLGLSLLLHLLGADVPGAHAGQEPAHGVTELLELRDRDVLDARVGDRLLRR